MAKKDLDSNYIAPLINAFYSYKHIEVAKLLDEIDTLTQEEKYTVFQKYYGRRTII